MHTGSAKTNPTHPPMAAVRIEKDEQTEQKTESVASDYLFLANCHK